MTVAANVNVGRITQIIGPVMDIEFPAGKMPNIYNALTITGQNKDFDYNLPDGTCTGPLVLCVHVKFDGSNGEVIFAGAGARFEEK